MSDEYRTGSPEFCGYCGSKMLTEKLAQMRSEIDDLKAVAIEQIKDTNSRFVNLSARLDRLESSCRPYTTQYAPAEDKPALYVENERLKARVKELEEALEPFANEAWNGHIRKLLRKA